MPLEHINTFRVRHYECDAYQHVNHANYIRYMQQAAFDASAAAGYDAARYDALGQYWLIHETDIEYLRPLFYGDTVQVRTWVNDFRRVRSQRAYEISNADTGEIVARATTDWVYIDNATERPTAIPDHLIDAFFPDGPPENSRPRERFPTAPSPAEDVFQFRQRVQWGDVDTMRHANNASYFRYIENTNWAVCENFHWPVERLWEEGLSIVTRRHRIKYIRPALLNDDLAIDTYAINLRRSLGDRHYRMFRPADGAEIAEAYSNYIWADVATGRPRSMPDELRDDFAPNTVYVNMRAG